MKKLIVVLGVAGSSLSAVFVRVADAPPMVLVLYRVGFAAAFLLPVLVLRCRAEIRGVPPKYFICAAISGMFLSFHFTAYFQSLSYTSIASSVALVDTEVFFIALATFLLLREKLGTKHWAAILVTFSGTVVIALADAGSGNNVLLGDFLALTGACFLSVYTMLGVFCRKKMSTTVYTFTVYFSAALTLLLILCVQHVKITQYPRVNVLSGIGLAVFCTLLGHSLFSWVLKYEKPTYVSASKMLEPVFATGLGIAFFREFPSAFVAAGGALVVLGIVCYTLLNSEARPADSPDG